MGPPGGRRFARKRAGWDEFVAAVDGLIET
jgi:hypothetical protein